jgi:hypothetical protein
MSPILFLLYTEPIYRLGDAQGRSGYADDVATLCFVDSAESTAAEATRKIDELAAWGAVNGMAFDPDKTEVMHFSRWPTRNAPAVRQRRSRKASRAGTAVARDLARPYSVFQDKRREADGQGPGRGVPPERAYEHEARTAPLRCAAGCPASGASGDV